ncbi:MAG: V-containing nitrogenase subunit delta [Rhodomicrobium sp.]|jgi:nitrogenase delta subunit
MTTEKVDQLFGYVQERCLWQFFSRTWDRKENLDGIMKTATDLLTGASPKRETPMDKLFYADASIMVRDFKERFPWIEKTAPAEIAALMQGLKDRVEEISITKSLNHELNHSLY